MPVPVNLGSHAVYVQQLRGILEGSQASAALANEDYINFLGEAADGLQALRWVGTPEQLTKLPAPDKTLQRNHPSETAYLQYTSGSTRAPRGVIITERALMSNLKGIVRTGLEINPDESCGILVAFLSRYGFGGHVNGTNGCTSFCRLLGH